MKKSAAVVYLKSCNEDEHCRFKYRACEHSLVVAFVRLAVEAEAVPIPVLLQLYVSEPAMNTVQLPQRLLQLLHVHLCVLLILSHHLVKFLFYLTVRPHIQLKYKQKKTESVNEVS